MGRYDKPALHIGHLNKVIYLPADDSCDTGEKVLARINWIREIEHPFYLAALSFCDNYPYETGFTEWILESDPVEGFKPVRCSLYYDP